MIRELGTFFEIPDRPMTTGDEGVAEFVSSQSLRKACKILRTFVPRPCLALWQRHYTRVDDDLSNQLGIQCPLAERLLAADRS